MEAGGSVVQSDSQLHSEFKASLDEIPPQKKKKNKQIRKKGKSGIREKSGSESVHQSKKFLC